MRHISKYEQISGGKRTLIEKINQCVAEGCAIEDIEFLEPSEFVKNVRGVWCVKPKSGKKCGATK